MLFIISSLGTCLAINVWDLGFWRIVGGLGIGIGSVIAPAYISEISPRHTCAAASHHCNNWAITTGIFAALLTDAVLAASANGADQPLWLGLEA